MATVCDKVLLFLFASYVGQLLTLTENYRVEREWKHFKHHKFVCVCVQNETYLLHAGTQMAHNILLLAIYYPDQDVT